MKLGIRLVETTERGCTGCVYDTLDGCGCGHEEPYSCIPAVNQWPEDGIGTNYIFIEVEEEGDDTDGS